MISLRQYYKQKKISGKEMNGFLKQIQEAVEETERFLLNPNRLLLDPDYIFAKMESAGSAIFHREKRIYACPFTG